MFQIFFINKKAREEKHYLSFLLSMDLAVHFQDFSMDLQVHCQLLGMKCNRSVTIFAMEQLEDTGGGIYYAERYAGNAGVRI